MDTGATPQTAGGATVGSDVVRAVGQVVTALAAGVGIIYLVGGLIIWLRLAFIRKPQLAVVSELPREVVISVGIVVVALALGVGAIYALWRLVVRVGDEKPPRALGDIRKTWSHRPGRVALLGAMLAAPSWLIFVFFGDRSHTWIGTLWIGHWYGNLAAAVAAWTLAVIWAIFSFRLLAKLGERYWISAAKEVDRQDVEVDRAKNLREQAGEAAASALRAAVTAQEAAERANTDAEMARQAAREAPDDTAESLRLEAEAEEQRAETENRRAEKAKRRADDAELNARRAEAALVQADQYLVPQDERVESRAREAFNTPTAVVINALLWSLVWVPSFLVAAASLPLAEARACVAGQYLDGEFIGETSERMYLSETNADRIVSIPLSDVSLVYIGDEARYQNVRRCSKLSTTTR